MESVSYPSLIPKSYKFIKNIDKGTFGIVSLIEAPQQFALKEIKIEDEVDLEKAKNEFDIMKKNIPHVVRSFSHHYEKSEEKFYYSMELMHQNLEDFIKSKNSGCDNNDANSTFLQILPVLKDIITGLHFLYKQGGAIHRDLKPKNILLDHGGRAYIADVGEAKFLNLCRDSSASVHGTKSWMAPEVINLLAGAAKLSYKNLPKTDVFSLGLIMLYCLDYKEFLSVSSKSPFRLNVDEADMQKYLDSLKVRGTVPQPLFAVLSRMLSFNAEKRPSVADLYREIVEDHSKCASALTDFQQQLFPAQADQLLLDLQGDIEQKKKEEIMGIDLIKMSLEKIKDWKEGRELGLFLCNKKEIEDSAILLVSQSLVKLKQLRDLTLFLGTTSITDTALNHISVCLSQMKKLERLNLDVQQNDGITNKGLEATAGVLKGLCELKNLELGFGGCKKISDQGIESLAEAMSNLKNIVEFRFNIWKNEKITDKSVESISNQLKTMKNLRILGISASGTKTTNQSVTVISKSVGKLQQLVLYFDSTGVKMKNSDVRKLIKADDYDVAV